MKEVVRICTNSTNMQPIMQCNSYSNKEKKIGVEKEIVTHGDRSNDLPTLEDCTVLGACKEEQGGWVATIDELLRKVARRTCLLPHLKAFPFSLLGGQPKRKEKERKLSL